LTRQVDRFSPGYLHSQIFNKTDPAKVPESRVDLPGRAESDNYDKEA
jgi:hypothetical protein